MHIWYSMYFFRSTDICKHGGWMQNRYKKHSLARIHHCWRLIIMNISTETARIRAHFRWLTWSVLQLRTFMLRLNNFYQRIEYVASPGFFCLIWLNDHWIKTKQVTITLTAQTIPMIDTSYQPQIISIIVRIERVELSVCMNAKIGTR